MKKELVYSKMLEETGLSREHAEVHLRVIEDAVKENVATKSDLKEEIFLVRRDMADMRSDLQIQITELRGQITEQRIDLEGQITALRGDVEGQITALRGDLQEQITGLQGNLNVLGAKVDTLKYELTVKTALIIAALAGLNVLLKFM